MTPIEALYQRAQVNPDGVAFIVGDDKWKYGIALRPQIRVPSNRLERSLFSLHKIPRMQTGRPT